LAELKLVCVGIGFLFLVGMVVNIPILIVEKPLHNINSQQMQPLSAIIESVRSRLQPMIMSSITTILGFVPLVFLPGEERTCIAALASWCRSASCFSP